jgi:hypothetical protein
MYQLKWNPKTITCCSKKLTEWQVQPIVTLSPNLPHDTQAKVTLVARPLLTEVVQTCAGTSIACAYVPSHQLSSAEARSSLLLRWHHGHSSVWIMQGATNAAKIYWFRSLTIFLRIEKGIVSLEVGTQRFQCLNGLTAPEKWIHSISFTGFEVMLPRQQKYNQELYRQRGDKTPHI